MEGEMTHITIKKPHGFVDVKMVSEEAANEVREEITRLTKELEEAKKPTLYDGLCKTIIGRILEAEANCEPEHDILLRLETIIRGRDDLRTKLEAADQINLILEVQRNQLADKLEAAEKETSWTTEDCWCCEKHPDRIFPHGDCSGPGMPDRKGRAAKKELERLRYEAQKMIDDDEENELSLELNKAGKHMMFILNGGQYL